MPAPGHGVLCCAWSVRMPTTPPDQGDLHHPEGATHTTHPHLAARCAARCRLGLAGPPHCTTPPSARRSRLSSARSRPSPPHARPKEFPLSEPNLYSSVFVGFRLLNLELRDPLTTPGPRDYRDQTPACYNGYMKPTTRTEPVDSPAIPHARPSTAPAALSRPPRPKQAGPRHDTLCLESYQEAHALTIVDRKIGKTLLDQNEEDVPTLSRCYCMHSCCWVPTGTVGKTAKHPEGRQTGRCICRHCPCWQEYMDRTPNLPSTRHTSSLKR